MEKIIKIDLKDEDDLYETYSNELVSKDLIDYIIESSNTFTAKDSIKIIINNYTNSDNCIKLIKEGFRNEYYKSLKKYRHNNIIQIIYLLIGIFILFVAMFFENNNIIHEILLISGWVLIWEMVEIELLPDPENRHRRKVLKYLKNAEIIVNNK